MNLKKLLPVGVARGPAADAVKVGGPIAQLIGSPGEEKDIVDRPQTQDVGGDFGRPENDKARGGSLYRGPQFLADFFLGDFFHARRHHGVASRHKRRTGSAFGHGIFKTGRQVTARKERYSQSPQRGQIPALAGSPIAVILANSRLMPLVLIVRRGGEAICRSANSQTFSKIRQVEVRRTLYGGYVDRFEIAARRA